MITGRKIGLVWICLVIGTPNVCAEWRIGTRADSSKTAQIIDISSTGELRLDSQPAIPATDWFMVKRPNPPLPEPSNQATIFLTNGDCVPCRIVDSDGTNLRVMPAFQSSKSTKLMSFPLNSVIGWFRNPPSDVEWAELSAKARSRDLLSNRKGDLLSGSLSSIDNAGIHLKDGAKTTTTDLDAVVSLLLNTDLSRIRKLRGRNYRVRLIDGTRLTVPLVSMNASNFTLKTAANDSFELPIELLLAVYVEQGPALSLSDLKPTKQDYQSLDGEIRTWREDLNAFGNPLRLAEPAGQSRYSRGVGLPGGMTIVYELGGKYKRLQTTVGMDAINGRRGELILKIIADGKMLELPEKGQIGLKPVDLSIDLTGCKSLSISVARDRRPGVQEALNLVDAWLIP